MSVMVVFLFMRFGIVWRVMVWFVSVCFSLMVCVRKWFGLMGVFSVLVVVLLINWLMFSCGWCVSLIFFSWFFGMICVWLVNFVLLVVW